MEILLGIMLLFGMIGLGYYIANKSFSKNIKSFDLSIGKNGWLKVHNEFYKK